MVGTEAAVLYAVTTIFAIAFSTAFIGRAHLLLEGSPIRKSPRAEGWLKLAIAISLFMVHNRYLVKALGGKTPYEWRSLVSLVMSGWAASALLLVLLVEQYRGSGPSDVATLYYFASIITDAVFLRDLVDDPLVPGPHRVVLVRCLGHTCLLALELRTKSPAYDKDGQPLSPEERHGILNRSVFAWVNPVLARGYTSILSEQDMPVLRRDMTPKRYRGLMIHWWSQRDKPESKYALHRALFCSVRKPFLAAILPRAFLILFRYCQPSLIKETIRYVASYPNNTEDGHSFRLVLAAVVIYVGLAISTAAYQHRINRLKLATRSAVIGLIHAKTMTSPSLASDNGETTSLMSTDAESLDVIGEMAHETWAQVVEVLIGIVLLAGQVGWIWPLPLFLIYLCSHVSRFVARNLQPGQTAWNLATQDRIAATSSMIAAIKTVKMLGMQNSLYERILNLRAHELSTASRLRWVMVYYNASANALGIFSPAITLAIYAMLSAAHGSRLDTETAFTTMAILSMVTHPANMVMTIVPRAVAALSGFERIQEFMLRPSLKPHREILSEARADTTSHTSGNREPEETDNIAVRLRNVTIGDNPPLLSQINIEMPAGALTIISGPTGSGKSTLIRAILGEVVPAEGTVSVSVRQTAYCAQRPWLPNGTIMEAIYGATNLSNTSDQEQEAWYGAVTRACCLTQDFDSLIDGDQTQIGSRGLNLSGGQRQRVTLARALFAKCDTLIVDDVLSGLDGDTEQAIFDNIFGPKGLLRQSKTTVILVTNSAQHFPSADHVVVLGNGSIVDQGPWENLHITSSLIAKFSSDYQAREKNDTVLSENFEKLSTQVRTKDEIKADLSRQSGDPALYGYYLMFVGQTNICRVVACTATYAFFITIPQYWLQMWTESGGASTTYYVSRYLFIAFMAWASTSMQMWSVLTQLAPRSGSLIHKRLLDIITCAPLAYFSQTDNGSILNRFSQDIQLIDKQLPGAFQTIVTQIFKLLMQIIFLCLAEKWLALSLPVCVMVVYVVQRLYLRTSRQLRYLELESRAGVFSSFLESVEGLETIRAFNWANSVCQENTACVDKAQRPEFLLLCLQRWLGIVLDLLAAGIATTAVAIAVSFRGSVTGAQVGIALNVMLVANSTLLKLVESWTALETSLGAMARLKALEETIPSERGDAWGFEPRGDWPSEGQLVIRDITASYRPGSVAIQSLTLNVSAGQKLIIFGRTGSGKSTLLLTLLRLLELQSGSLELDGIDIKQVNLDLLRQRCFVTLSQDPLLLPNETVRLNLDPDGLASRDSIVSALERVGLWPHFRAAMDIHNAKAKPLSTPLQRAGVSEQDDILNRQLSLFPEMSVGQTQLFALSRALIKAAALRQRFGVRPVVLLDEATSSLDTATESAIYRIIDEELTAQGHTVIMVAHRLDVLREYTRPGRDTVVSMADGRLASVDMV